MDYTVFYEFIRVVRVTRAECNCYLTILSLDSSDTRKYLTFDSLEQCTTTSRDV